MTDEHASVHAALTRFLEQVIPDARSLTVSGLYRAGTGASRENWPFDLQWQDASGNVRTDRLVLRRDPAGEVVATARSAEFGLLQALQRTPVPAPIVRWLDNTGEHLLRPAMIVDRYDGVADRAALRDSDPLRLGLPGQVALAEQLCDTLVLVHQVDVQASGIADILPDPGPRPAERELDTWEEVLNEQELEPQPALRLSLSWMREHLPPPPPRQTVVHGDFRPGNVLVAEGRIEVLLDWELSHRGDPIDDLGWYLAPLYRREHFVAGGFGPDDFLARYEKRSGAAVHPEAVHFWEVMATFRLAVMALTGVRAFCSGEAQRPAPPPGVIVSRVADAILNP